MPDGSGFDLDVNERNSPDTSERLPQRATVYGPEGTVSADSIHNSQEEVNSALPDLRFSQKAGEGTGSAIEEAGNDKRRGRRLSERADGEETITMEDVAAIQSIGRKSVNAFSSDEIRTAEPFARRYWRELGVKSPFFRAWFGDWRANDRTPVQLVRVAGEAAPKSGRAINADTGRPISWGHTLKGETRAHGTKNALESIKGIDRIIETAVLLDTVSVNPTGKSKLPGTAFMHSLYSLVDDGNGLTLYRLFAEEAVPVGGGDPFTRAYELKEIKEVATTPDSVLSVSGGLTDGAPATTYTVADLFAFVKYPAGMAAEVPDRAARTEAVELKSSQRLGTLMEKFTAAQEKANAARAQNDLKGYLAAVEDMRGAVLNYQNALAVEEKAGEARQIETQEQTRKATAATEQAVAAAQPAVQEGYARVAAEIATQRAAAQQFGAQQAAGQAQDAAGQAEAGQMAAGTFAPDPALPNSGFPVSIAQYDDDTKRQIVRAFAAYEMSGVDTADRIVLGVVPEQLATDVERIAQIDIHGFDNVLQADGLRHGAKHDGRTGNKPVTPEDVAALLDIFDTYNNITVTSKRGETSIKLSKTGADGMTYVAVIGKKKGHIFTKNMWKGQTKGDGSFRRTDAHNAPASTPAAAANYEPSTDSLPENVQDGKGTTGFLPSTADATGRPQAQAREPMRANRADAAATPQGAAQVDVMDELVRGAGTAVSAQETEGTGARARSAMEAAMDGTEEPGARPAGQGKRRYRAGVNRADTAVRLDAADRMQLRVLDGLGKKYGVKIVIEDSIRYEDGEGRVYAGTSNGYYDRSDGTIHVALDAEGGAYLFFGVHELTHKLRAENADAYAALEAFVLNKLEASELYGALTQGEGGTLEERIASVQALYAARGQELSRGEALEELVCDAIPVILTDEQAVRELVRTDRTLAERIRDFFEEFYHELTRQLAGVVYGPGNRAEAAALMNDAETVRELAELFQTAMESSADLQYELLTQSGSAIEEAGTTKNKRFSAKDDRAASIREQIRAYAEKLNGMQAVAVIESGSRPKKNGKPDRFLERQELLKYYGNTASSVDRQGFGRIEFDQNAIAQLVKYLNSDAEFAAAKAAPAVVKRGIEIDHHTEHKGRNDIESYTFAAPVVLNGKRGNEAVVVQRTNRNKPHAVRIVMPDGSGFDLDVNERNSPDTSERLPQRATVYGPEGTVSADSIHNSQEEVNSALPNLRFSQKADAEGGSAPGRIYDYSKPFAEQVDDWMAGRTPQYDTLLIGRTPLLYRQIGLSDVPMTIDQTHLDYMINGTKNADHHLGMALVRQLPELLEHPVAVIESATRPDDSVMAIVKGKVNGRQLVAAVRIGGNGVQNGAQIDSNHIVSAQGRGNAITKLLNDALQKELRGEVGVYYWNKEEALPLTVQSGVQFPGGRINDGLIHSIFDAASPVNRNYLEQTETRQFKRWFGRSGVVQADGTPRAVRQGVDAAVEVLDGNTALQDGEAVYVKLENPYPVGTAAEVPDRAALEAGGYDGAVYQDGNGGTHYAVLDGTQLKSATDNTGTFDGRNHNLRFSRKAGERTESAPGRIYDYSKPFAEQVDDWMAGRTPQYDTLLIGRTPLLYRQIGLSDVPMTIDQTHLDYMVNGTKNEDHHLGVALVRQLPELLEHPVAVIESATRPGDSVMAIVRGKVNGRQLVAAVRIGGNGVQNGAQIDSNHIVSAQGRGNAVTKLLNDALQKELRGEVGVYYWNKEEALPLMAESGVQFPGFPINDGLVHSIFDAASPVNRKYMDQIHTFQFKRWFGRSGVVQTDGTPRAVRQRAGDRQGKGQRQADGSGGAHWREWSTKRSADRQQPYRVRTGAWQRHYKTVERCAAKGAARRGGGLLLE